MLHNSGFSYHSLRHVHARRHSASAPSARKRFTRRTVPGVVVFRIEVPTSVQSLGADMQRALGHCNFNFAARAWKFDHHNLPAGKGSAAASATTFVIEGIPETESVEITQCTDFVFPVELENECRRSCFLPPQCRKSLAIGRQNVARVCEILIMAYAPAQRDAQRRQPVSSKSFVVE